MARATFRPGAKVGRIERKLDNPTPILKQIGALMLSESQEAFRAQKFDRKKWTPRAPVNVFGVISDFAQGRKAPLARRFERTPVLSDTGRLRASISFRLLGTRAVEVGSNVKYAAVHQTGGPTESEKLTPTVRKALWRWLRQQGLEMRRRLGWLLNKKFAGQTIKGEVPARPFVGITRQTIKDVRAVIGVEISEA